MQLVVLAAGHGRRFGGLKQLAPVGPNGEAIMDYTARAAQACHFDGIVLVVREEIRDEVGAHIRRRWSKAIPTELVCQPSRPGTAQAVLGGPDAVDGPFVVVNADDLYGEEALGTVRSHFFPSPSRGNGSSGAPVAKDHRHLLVGYQLTQTVLTSEPVTRGLCKVGPDSTLERIVEHTVQLLADGNFEATPLRSPTNGAGPSVRVSASACVSMNLWGFHPRVFAHVESALEKFARETPDGKELILPDVIADLVEAGSDSVRVVTTTARCIGITHKNDIAIVRDELAVSSSDNVPLRTGNRT